MPDRIYIKRGDSLALDCTAWLTPPKGADAGVSRDLSVWAPECQMRHAQTGMKVKMTVIVGDPLMSGRFVISARADETSKWPTGCWHADIQFTDMDTVKSTDTFIIQVLEDITT